MGEIKSSLCRRHFDGAGLKIHKAETVLYRNRIDAKKEKDRIASEWTGAYYESTEKE